MSQMMIDTMYCFYDDVLGEKFNPGRIHYEKASEKRLIHDLPWNEQDPDAYSHKLYEYHQFLWGKALETQKSVHRRVKGREILCLKSDKKIITSDYIGPSSYHASQSGISDEELGKYLLVTRTIGGHVLWPIGLSVNVARGWRFADRFDVTLFDLKRWYAGTSCRLSKQWDTHKEWLESFGSFVGFIRFFMLQSFVNEKYEVLDLSSIDNKIIIEYPEHMVLESADEYKIYFNNSIEAIEKRNALIEEFSDSEANSVLHYYKRCDTKCRCGSYNISEVSFGLPSLTGRVLAKMGYTRFGGCILQTHNKRYHCNNCNIQWERNDKNTPNGGKYSVMYIFPKESEDKHTLGEAGRSACEIVEYDENDNMIMSTQGFVMDGNPICNEESVLRHIT